MHMDEDGQSHPVEYEPRDSDFSHWSQVRTGLSPMI